MVSLPEQDRLAVVTVNVSNELKVRVRARYSSFNPFFLSAAIWEESISHFFEELRRGFEMMENGKSSSLSFSASS